jgi:zinc-ribbon domain
MKRLLPRPPRRRARRAQETEGQTASEAQPTEVRPAVPAGAEPADPAAPPQPTFRNRGRLRRRMRFLRRVRELGYRDLGGLVFDQHRFNRRSEDLVRAKVAALTAVDAELRALEDALRAKRDITELREPGISACPRCGTLHGSDANFCPSCGLALTGARALAPDVGEGVHGARPQLPSAGPPPEAATNHLGAIERDAAARERERPRLGDGTPASDGGDQPTAVIQPRPEPREP